MHPALSVIFFTTLSGLGYGVWVWLGLQLALAPPPTSPRPATALLIMLALGGVLSAIGLLASFWHLGKPLRAWRAFSQWRTSWLSREGVMAVLCFVPAALLLLAPVLPWGAVRALGAVLAVCAMLTVACTAMIYASLKPIPAWRHPLVLPVYLGFSVSGGGLVWLALMPGHSAAIAGLLVLALALAGLKWRYWSDIDIARPPQTRGDAVGLPGRPVSVFEHPHTEANYITREMGFVVARRNARALRRAAMVLFAALPAIGLALVLTGAMAMGGWLWLLPLSLLAGSFIERWLFFAQARHMVTLYY